MADVRASPDARELERRWAVVRLRMEAASESLARQGSVAWRMTPGGTRVVSVRYVEEIDGRRVQRAIYLGAECELVGRARNLIRQYRERERWACEVEEAARFVSASGSLLRRMPSARAKAPARAERRHAWGTSAWSKESSRMGWKLPRRTAPVNQESHPPPGLGGSGGARDGSTSRPGRAAT